MKQTTTQQALIQRCRDGDEKAQFTLYQQYAKAMLNTAYRIVNDKEEAKDVLQEAFLRAFTYLHKYNEQASFGAWLRKIVVNTAINALKKRNRRFIRLSDTFIPEAPPESEVDLDVQNLLLSQVRAAIQQLPDGYRTVLSLYLIEGYDHKEIAQILGIATSTSISQYHRAKKKLIHLLKSQPHHEPIRTIYSK